MIAMVAMAWIRLQRQQYGRPACVRVKAFLYLGPSNVSRVCSWLVVFNLILTTVWKGMDGIVFNCLILYMACRQNDSVHGGVRIKAGSKSGEASPLRWFQVQARVWHQIWAFTSICRFSQLHYTYKFVQKVAQNQLGMHFVGRTLRAFLEFQGKGYRVTSIPCPEILKPGCYRVGKFMWLGWNKGIWADY